MPPKVGVDVFRVNSLTLLPKTALLRGGAAIKVWWEAEGFPHALALWTVRTVLPTTSLHSQREQRSGHLIRCSMALADVRVTSGQNAKREEPMCAANGPGRLQLLWRGAMAQTVTILCALSLSGVCVSKASRGQCQAVNLSSLSKLCDRLQPLTWSQLCS